MTYFGYSEAIYFCNKREFMYARIAISTIILNQNKENLRKCMQLKNFVICTQNKV
jgi:hypothetical protein